MNAKRIIYCHLALLIAFTVQASAQQQPSVPVSSSLILTNAIPLPNEQGRIDHFALDPAGRVFVCIVGNDKVAVVETSSDKEVHSISMPHPQGAVYVPEFNKLFVGSHDGKLFIFDGTTYNLIGSIDFGGDTDNVRYEPSGKRVYVGHGDGLDAGIAAVDPRTNQRLEEDYKLDAHPESFQLETSGQRIFVNLPDLKQIDVIDRKTGSVAKWPMANYRDNFPMALDEGDHRLFVGAKTPPRLVVLNTDTGEVVAALPSVADTDDLYYDAEYHRIYMPGGQGYISVFDQTDPDRYKLLENIPSSLGARTGGFAAKIGKKGAHRFFLGVPARSGHDAELWIYQAQESN
jgi:hypothetical protein